MMKDVMNVVKALAGMVVAAFLIGLFCAAVTIPFRLVGMLFS